MPEERGHRPERTSDGQKSLVFGQAGEAQSEMHWNFAVVEAGVGRIGSRSGHQLKLPW